SQLAALADGFPVRAPALPARRKPLSAALVADPIGLRLPPPPWTFPRGRPKRQPKPASAPPAIAASPPSGASRDQTVASSGPTGCAACRHAVAPVRPDSLRRQCAGWPRLRVVV